MKILIDIGHPAHVHYFKNFIWIMEKKGHLIYVIARDKEVINSLLVEYKIHFISRGEGGKNLIHKLLYIIKADYIIFKNARRIKPDIFISFSSPYAAHISFLMGKPNITFDDTEHAKFEIILYAPFVDVILNPKSYWRKFSKKQLFFNGFMELCHLHPAYFKPDPQILEKYGIQANDRFFILRFVSWQASHDIGQSGLTSKIKEDIIDFLKNIGKVLITSEEELPEELKKYKLTINPAHLHHFLFYADLYIGEGATTASEAVLLGTSSIYINSLNAGTLNYQSDNYGLVSLRSPENILNIIERKLNQRSISEKNRFRERISLEKIDVTAFMVWFIENYPASKAKLIDNPEIENTFINASATL